jgi:hypothetical protein
MKLIEILVIISIIKENKELHKTLTKLEKILYKLLNE